MAILVCNRFYANPFWPSTLGTLAAGYAVSSFTGAALPPEVPENTCQARSVPKLIASKSVAPLQQFSQPTIAKRSKDGL